MGRRLRKQIAESTRCSTPGDFTTGHALHGSQHLLDGIAFADA